LYDRLRDLGFDPLVTSATEGKHVKNSAHYAGKAIDIGAINGVTVGDNPATFNALLDIIEKGGVKKIGTTKGLAGRRDLQQWAQQHGVELFIDEGTGPHIHAEVS
jgi:hypothetical protein